MANLRLTAGIHRHGSQVDPAKTRERSRQNWKKIILRPDSFADFPTRLWAG